MEEEKEIRDFIRGALEKEPEIEKEPVEKKESIPEKEPAEKPTFKKASEEEEEVKKEAEKVEKIPSKSGKVERLFSLAESRGLLKAIQIALKTGDAYTIDTFRDQLAEGERYKKYL